MAWAVRFTSAADRQFRQLPPAIRKRIIGFLDERVRPLANPRSLAKPLKGSKPALWRYRVGDYRIICQIKDDIVTVLVVTIGHRGAVYRS